MRYEFGEHSLDVSRRELRRAGDPISLEPQVFDLIVYLLRNRDRVVSRDDLIDGIWGGRIVSDSAVTTRINAARRALADSGAAQAIIRTIPRKGVRFIAEVREDGFDAESLPPPQPGFTTPAPAKPAILVLPFRSLGADGSEDYLADAVTSDLTVDLSRMRDMAVISAATALTYKGSTLDVRQIGRDLGIRYLVIGSIGRSGELVRTNVQLLDAASGEQLWGDRFQHRFVDLGNLEDEITGRIAASLNIQLVRAEARRADQVPQPDALDLRLRATALLYSSVAPEHTLATRLLLQRSAALDPHSAETWACLGQMIASDYLTHWNDTGREQLEEAAEAIRKALLIDPNHALAHRGQGLIERARGEHYLALEAFTRAIELDRNFAAAYADRGNQLILLGRAAEAPALVEQAIRLSPYDASIGMYHWILGRAYFFIEQYEEAIAWLRRSIETRSNLWFNRLYLVSACALADDLVSAARVLSEFNRLFPNPVYTVAVVKARESATPNDNPVVVTAREKFHEGLIRAGMAER
ncbi:MAG TPA: winged helix-turn-helix domain-containing protein [Stellaceae bacterium]|nr:winged helix-turn-helix domain-containing protein [Stellaceae bacterium]